MGKETIFHQLPEPPLGSPGASAKMFPDRLDRLLVGPFDPRGKYRIQEGVLRGQTGKLMLRLGSLGPGWTTGASCHPGPGVDGDTQAQALVVNECQAVASTAPAAVLANLDRTEATGSLGDDQLGPAVLFQAGAEMAPTGSIPPILVAFGCVDRDEATL